MVYRPPSKEEFERQKEIKEAPVRIAKALEDILKELEKTNKLLNNEGK